MVEDASGGDGLKVSEENLISMILTGFSVASSVASSKVSINHYGQRMP